MTDFTPDLLGEFVAADLEQQVLGYYTYGNGAKHVLVLHDWMGDSSNYKPIMSYLDTSDYTYVFADIRGYGLSRYLHGEFSVREAAGDIVRLAERLGWDTYNLIGHSMTGMVAQRAMLDDWLSKRHRIKSVVTITPVSANGYPADEDTKKFLWDLIGHRDLSEFGFQLLTGQRYSSSWGKAKTDRHFQTFSEDALRAYYSMWLETDFSAEVSRAAVTTPICVIGGRQDLPGFQEPHLRKTFGTWYPNISFTFIENAGHYPMQETPVYLASLINEFLSTTSELSN